MFRELLSENDLRSAVDVMRRAFATVAAEMNFTKENAPTNAAFMTYERLKESIDKGIHIYGLFNAETIIGTVAIERSSDNEGVFYLERLAVVPEMRHMKKGKSLLDFAFDKVREMDGRKISIGTINENVRLKQWYLDYGFVETSIRSYEHLPFSVCFMEKNISPDSIDC
jgi:ribosomal protein S18 acetylase RimI-like enzyme